MPGPFTSKSFSATLPNSLAARYRKALQKHPFLLFGLPFVSTIVLGSFMLTPATALRYERYDRKNQQVTQEEAMGLRGERRKVNMKDEYYVSTRLAYKDVIWQGADSAYRGYKRKISKTGNSAASSGCRASRTAHSSKYRVQYTEASGTASGSVKGITYFLDF
jgi:cytochrome c oxidase assembly protein subunit 16